MIAASQLEIGVGRRMLLARMTFSIARGELIAVLGPNGVGKTTLLRAIAGIHAKTAGTLQIAGRDIDTYTSAQRARTIAFMTSDETPAEVMPVRDAVASGRYAHHRWWQWRENQRDSAIIARALAEVQMTDFATRQLDTLSSGELQRVWLALGLAQESPLLLLDEPTSHLDVRVSHEILQLLRRQADCGRSVVCVLHDMNEALEFADRLMVLGEGGILAFEAPEAVVQSNALDRAYGIRLEALRSASGAVRVFPTA